MAKVIINNVEVELNKNEAKELVRINSFILERDYAQRSADIWMRSAPNATSQQRRKAAVRALGLSDEIKFL